MYVLEYCRYDPIHDLAYIYVVNGDSIEEETYLTKNCTDYPISVSTEYNITAPCQDNIEFTTISVGIADTNSPSHAPTLPTLSPTHTSKELCGSNKWCFEVDLYPIFGNEISQTVGMTNEIDEHDTE